MSTIPVGGLPPSAPPGLNDAYDPNTSTQDPVKEAKLNDLVSAFQKDGVPIDKDTANKIYKELEQKGLNPKNMTGDEMLNSIKTISKDVMAKSMGDQSMQSLGNIFHSKPDLSGGAPDSTV